VPAQAFGKEIYTDVWEPSDRKVWFSLVQWHTLLNPELNFWFSSGLLPLLEPEP
jgi:hypothetical protein